jgi:hypothetical protein
MQQDTSSNTDMDIKNNKTVSSHLSTKRKGRFNKYLNKGDNEKELSNNKSIEIGKLDINAEYEPNDDKNKSVSNIKKSIMKQSNDIEANRDLFLDNDRNSYNSGLPMRILQPVHSSIDKTLNTWDKDTILQKSAHEGLSEIHILGNISNAIGLSEDTNEGILFRYFFIKLNIEVVGSYIIINFRILCI